MQYVLHFTILEYLITQTTISFYILDFIYLITKFLIVNLLSFSASKPLDVVFVVEVSHNVEVKDLEKFKTFILSTIPNFYLSEDSVRVALMTYSATPKGVVMLNDFRTQAEWTKVVTGLEIEGGAPDVISALTFLKNEVLDMDNGARDNVAKQVFFLTSGKVPDVQINQVCSTVEIVPRNFNLRSKASVAFKKEFLSTLYP